MNRRRRFSLLLAGLVVCVLAPVIQGRKAPNIVADTPAGTSVADAGRLDWWRDARFGLFIHWGPISLKGTEISWSRANS
ncbi:MAG: alpha-L-fucosidase, partial [Candidatus Aminicenantales bacterium]